MNFLTNIALARYLGIEEFGRYSLAWTVVVLLATLHNSLVMAPMMSITSKLDEDKRAGYFATYLIHHLCFLAFVAVLVPLGLLVTDRLYPSWEVLVLVLPLTLAAGGFLTREFARRYFFARRRPVVANIVDILSSSSQLSAVVVLGLLYDFDHVEALWVMAIACWLALPVGLCFLGTLAYSGTVFREATARGWRFSKWVTGNALLAWASNSAATIVAGALLGPIVVGALRAAYNLVGVLHILYFALENFLPVRAGQKLREGGIPALLHFLKRAAVFGATGTGCVVLALALAPGFWLNLTYGPEFAEYAILLQLVSISYFLLFFNLIVRIGLATLEHTRPLFLVSLPVTVTHVAATYPLALWFGAVGLVGGNIVKVLIQVTALTILFRRKIASLTREDRSELRAASARQGV